LQLYAPGRRGTQFADAQADETKEHRGQAGGLRHAALQGSRGESRSWDRNGDGMGMGMGNLGHN